MTGLAAVFAMFICVGPAMAQVLSAEPVAEEASAWARMVAWLMAQQRVFHEQLTEALQTLSHDGGAAAAWALIAASFLYGVFHAAGPGHGKAVLTTYLLSNRESLRRGTLLAAAAALCQALSALAIVYGLVYLAGWLPRDANAAASWGERASFVLVLLLGAWLTWRAVRRFWRMLPTRVAAADVHEPGAHCGHNHAPDPDAVSSANTMRAAVVLVLSIGLRPCTGAVLVLIFAHAAGIAWAGIAAVFAMATGTGLAVAALAFVAVNLRCLATAMVAHRAGPWTAAGSLVGLAGGLVLIAIGLSLLVASFVPSHPLGI